MSQMSKISGTFDPHQPSSGGNDSAGATDVGNVDDASNVAKTSPLTTAWLDAGQERMQQLTVYIKETDHVHHRPLFLEILELVRANSGAGATVIKGLAGYSHSTRAISTAGLADVQQKLPLIIFIVDEAWRIEMMLPQIEEWVHVNGGLVTVQDIEAHRHLHPHLPRGKQQNPVVRVGDIMERHVATVHPEESAADVVSRLMGKYYKSLPVVDRDNRVIGMITDGDLMDKGKLPYRLSILEALEASGEQGFQDILESLLASHKLARDLMSVGDIVTTRPDTLAIEAAQLMVARKIKRIPVVDLSGRLMGIVGRLDILKLAGAIFPHAGINGEDLTDDEPAHSVLRLGDVMSTDVPVVTGDTPMHTVVELLSAPPCPRRAVVVDNEQHGHVVGIIADRDLVLRTHSQSRPGLLRMLREGLPFRRLPAEQQVESARMEQRTAAEIMSRNVVVAPAAMPIPEAVRLLVQREIKLLPVVDHTGKLLGVVSRTRILEVLVTAYSEQAPGTKETRGGVS